MHGKSLVGNSIIGEGSSRFSAFNPATGEKLEPEFTESTGEEITRAVKLAEAAFEQLRTESIEKRASFLDRIGEEILALGDDLLKRANAETGLPLERLTGERGRTVNQLRLFAALIREGSWVEASIDNAIPDRQPLPKPDIRRMLLAVGPVAVFGASNFPLAFSVAGGDTASALAAGCSVVVKAHPAHPGTSELVGTAIIKAAVATGMPEGTFSLITGTSTDSGLALVRNPGIKAVGFTGSFRGGKALWEAANARPEPIPVYAEMGSSNPVFVLPGLLAASGSRFAENLKNSFTLGVGQFCTCPGLVFGVEGPDLDAAANELKKLVEAAPAGVMLHSGIRDSFENGIARISSVEGTSLVRAATVTREGTAEVAPAVAVTSGQTFLQTPALAEEVFGPSTVFVACRNLEELRSAAESLEGHLTATVHGTEEDLKNCAWLINILEKKAGRLLINGFPTGVEVCPSMVHGGPYPATTDSRTTSVGTDAIKRFARPVCYQSFPQHLLPEALKDGNPLGIWRRIDGEFVKS